MLGIVTNTKNKYIVESCYLVGGRILSMVAIGEDGEGGGRIACTHGHVMGESRWVASPSSSGCPQVGSSIADQVLSLLGRTIA